MIVVVSLVFMCVLACVCYNNKQTKEHRYAKYKH